jgi:anti-sigma factor RsiW
MTNCWSEGALRAWLDRELPAADMKAVAAHLGECSACDALCTELAARAARVFSMLETLGEPAMVTKTTTDTAVAPNVRSMPSRTPSRWLWTGAAVALAAGLAIASLIVQKRQEAGPTAQAPTPVVTPFVQAPPVQPVAQDPASVPVAQSAVVRTSPRKPTVKPGRDYFLALDDEPIESGVIMRVAIQPGNAQADIVFDPGGRARAIRLVSNKH